jgi:hypothetical protein
LIKSVLLPTVCVELATSPQIYRVGGIAGRSPYLVAWSTFSASTVELRTRLIAENGKPLAPESAHGNPGVDTPRNVAFNGRHYATSVTPQGQAAELLRFDADGSLLGRTVLGSKARTGLSIPQVTWGNGQWVVAIAASLARVDVTGVLLAAGSVAGSEVLAAVAFNGQVYGRVAANWSVHRALFQPHDPVTGNPFASIMHFVGSVGQAGTNPQRQGAPTVIDIGSGFAMFWTDPHEELKMAVVSSDGRTVRLPATTIVASRLKPGVTLDPPRAVWNAQRGEIGLLYRKPTTQEPNTRLLRMATVKPDGNVISDRTLGQQVAALTVGHRGEYVMAVTNDARTTSSPTLYFVRF